MHYTEKRTAVACVGRALSELGWEILGWKEDQSDSMTDYFSPESWDGIATKGEFVACVDVGSYAVGRSGEPIHRSIPQQGPKCERCEGSGIDPLRITLKQARQDPYAYHLAVARVDCPGAEEVKDAQGRVTGLRTISTDGTVCTRMVQTLSGVVSPIPFGDDGENLLNCMRCHGQGHTFAPPKIEVIGHYPTFQANPKGMSWHVERAGRIVAKGKGLKEVLRIRDKTHSNSAEAGMSIAKLIDAVAVGKQGSAVAQGGGSDNPEHGNVLGSGEVDGVEVEIRTGKYEGKVELKFGAKPGEETRASLKAARFRFTFTNGGCWYGSREHLPEAYVALLGKVPAVEAPAPEDSKPEAPQVAPEVTPQVASTPELVVIGVGEKVEEISRTDLSKPEPVKLTRDTKLPKAGKKKPAHPLPELGPLEEIVPPVDAFKGHVGELESDYFTDGHMLIVRSMLITDPAHHLHLALPRDSARWSGLNPVANDKVKHTLELNVKGAKPFLLIGCVSRDYFEDEEYPESIALVGPKEDPFAKNGVAIFDAKLLRHLQIHTGFDEIRVRTGGGSAAALYRGGKVAGILMGLNKDSGFDKRIWALRGSVKPAEPPAPKPEPVAVHQTAEPERPQASNVTSMPALTILAARLRAAMGRLAAT
ncbi:MAG: hypothetical protein HS116_21040 [Planctomycetes bacterium]|nr:hypothetical protein [Planctomycetota bacterium]